MNDISEGYKLLEEKSYQKAYESFSNLYNKTPQNLQALYFRAVTDYLYLKNNLEQSKKDFLKIVNTKNNFKYSSYSYLTYISDEQQNYDDVITYGEMYLKFYQKGLIKEAIDTYYYITFIVAKAILLGANDILYDKGVEYISKYLNEIEDAPIEIYSLKLNFLLELSKFDEAANFVNMMQQNFGNCYLVYYSRFMLNNYMGESLKEKQDNNFGDYFDNALSDLDICLNYSESAENKDFLNNLKFEILYSAEKYDEARELIRKLNPNYQNKELLYRALHLNVDLKDDNILSDAVKIYENNPTPELAYEISYNFRATATTKEQILLALNFIKSAYNNDKKAEYLYEICYQNGLIFQYGNNFELINEYLKDNPTDGRAYFLLAVASQYLNKSYDEQISYFTKSYELGYLDEFQLYEHISPVMENTKLGNKKIKKLISKNPDDYDSYSLQKLAVRYLYGEDGFKIDYSKAFTYIQMILKDDDSDPCTNKLLGRYYEIAEKNYQAAFKAYDKAYNLAKNEHFIACNCSYATLAHAYLMGIGVEKNIEKSKSLILDAINKMDIYSDNMVIYLYTYFALKGENDFKLDLALKYLKSNLPFYRYEITRALFLIKVKERLNLKDSRDDKFLQDTLKHLNSSAKLYYKKNKDELVPYPYYIEF